jgi:uncharacterized protein DUF4190
MSEDSGQQPQQPQDEPGYWERKAAEEGGQTPPPPPAPQVGPASDQPAAPYPPAYPPSYPTAGAPGPYAGYTPPPPGYAPQHPGMPAFPVYVLPDNPKATSALVLGIIAVAGAFTCFLPVVVAPIAWILGAQARRQIRSAPQQWGGEGRATAGMVLGIIGTVLLVLALVAIAILIAVAINDPSAFDDNTGV